jgi:hypothetical protein
MGAMAAVETRTCETYDGLIEDCEIARKAWNERRTEISNLGLRGKRIDDELLCLQAKFAKSYALVRNHLHGCRCCESAGRTRHDSGHEGNGGFLSQFRLALFPGAHYSGF